MIVPQYTKFVTIDEQTIAQAEFDAYIDAQAQEIAPEPEIQFIDLDGFYNYEALAAGKTIATITHDCDDFVTQPWIVMVGDTEVHRTPAELETIQVDELVQWMGVQWAVKQGVQHNHAENSFRKHIPAIILEGYTEVDAIGLWMEHVQQQAEQKLSISVG